MKQVSEEDSQKILDLLIKARDILDENYPEEVVDLSFPKAISLEIADYIDPIARVLDNSI